MVVPPRRGPLGGLGVCALVALLSSCQCGDAGLQEGQPILVVEVLTLDFGKVPEGTRETRGIEVQNPGLKPLEVAAAVVAGSEEFGVGNPAFVVPPGGTAVLEVAFAPVGIGADEATLRIQSNDTVTPEVEVTLLGGPIEARLLVDPDPVQFTAGQPLVSRQVSLLNEGRAKLIVRAVGVDPAGNPDFSVSASGLPREVSYNQGFDVTVSYSRSTDQTEGVLVILSNDAAGEEMRVRLLPDAVPLCSDGEDNDLDGLTDFPDDPGCADALDDDEEDPPECVDDAVMPCGIDEGECTLGERTCIAGRWSDCVGGSAPGTESCNGLDDDCDGTTDEGVVESCGLLACEGTMTCVADSGVAGGEWGPCIPFSSSAESCDGTDEDCDGSTDEELVEACTVFGCPGSRACLTDGSGQWDVCVADNPQPEDCNNVDDDCDGVTDDGISPLVCTTFGCTGTRVCQVGGGGWGPCVPNIVDPETCDGTDEDCDGDTDEGVAPRGCDINGCPGTQSCPLNGDGTWGACTPTNPQPETCDGTDENCDGSTDEGLVGVPCSEQRGVCAGARELCQGSLGWKTCDATVYAAHSASYQTVETTCDGLDNDCDGDTDEDPGCASGCDPDGTYTLQTGGPIAKTCLLGLVEVSINIFTFSNDGAIISTAPSNPNMGIFSTPSPLVGAATTCPGGSFTNSTFFAGGPGGCDETYTLTGTFTGPDTWTGTYTAAFSGDLCSDCTTESWNITGSR